MKKLLNLLSSKIFWIIVGIIGLALLIWFFGGMLAIGEVKPLAHVYTKIGAIAVLCGFPIVRLLWKKYQESRINKNLVNEIKASQEPILKHVTEDSRLSKQFHEIDHTLKNAKFSNSNSFVDKFFNGQYLYQMPWYVVLGPAGSGKTTAIKQSGLNFPLESNFGSSINGLAGTRDCDWFLSDDAVLLDTAGRLALQDSNANSDAYDWKEFINLLKRYRPKQPINGVVVTVGVDDLIHQTEEGTIELANQLRKRINEMRSEFGINFPVYLTITKLDVLKGFDEFFSTTNDKHRECLLGFEISEDKLNIEKSALVVGYIEKELNRLKDSLDSTYLQLIPDMDNEDQKKALFAFSDDFDVLNKRLVKFFDGLYKSSKFEDKILWRGVYFTSAVQQGRRLDPFFNELSDGFELTNKYIDEDSQVNNNKSYFIHNLFAKTLIKEAELAEKNLLLSYKYQALRWLAIGSTIGLGLLVGFGLVNSYWKNSSYLIEVNGNAKALGEKLSSESETRSLFHAISMARNIKKTATVEGVDLNNPNINYRAGLYQGSSMQEVSNATYQRGLRETVLPLINQQLEDLLRDSMVKDTVNSYDALKAYLMLYDASHYDPKFMEKWVLKHIYNDSNALSEKEEIEVKEVLKYVLSPEVLSPSLPYDENLVDSVRQNIALSDISTIIINNAYEEIKKKADTNENEMKPVSFQSMGGNQAKLVFFRYSGKPLSEPINSVFTKKAYVEYVLPELLRVSASMHAEEDWVMGQYSSKQHNAAEALENAKQAYYKQYIKAWKDYTNDIAFKQPKTLPEAKDFVKILSDSKDSPLKKIIEGVGQNTTLDISEQLNDKTEQQMSNMARRLLSRAGLDRAANTAQDLALLDSIDTKTSVDEAFIDYNYLTTAKGGDAPRIDAVIDSANGLYEYLDELQISVDKGIELPPINSVVEFRGEVSRLPSPFRAMFENLSDQVLNVWNNEINDRELAEAEEKAEQERLLAEEEARQQALQEQKEAQLREEQKELEEKRIKEQQDREDRLREEKEKQQLEQAEARKVLEKDRLFLSIDSRYKPLAITCKNMSLNQYPFKVDGEDVALNNFTQLFGKSGFLSLNQLTPEAANIAGANTLEEIIFQDKRFDKFRKLKKVDAFHNRFFAKADGSLGFDFSIKVLELDERVDELVLSFDKQSLNHSHGPIVSFKSSWPVEEINSEFDISLFKSNEVVASDKKKGSWSLYRLIEAGELVQSSEEGMIVDYELNGYKFTLDFSHTSPLNPLDFRVLRLFNCP